MLLNLLKTPFKAIETKPLNEFGFSQAIKKDVFIDGEKSKKYKAICNADTKDVYAITTDHYKILQHDDAINYAINGLKKSGQDYNLLKNSTYKHGSKMFASFNLNKNFNFLGDVFNTVFKLYNSQNATQAYIGSLQVQRQVCTNGMMSMENAFTYSFNHRSKIIETDIASSIELNLEKLHNYWINKLKTYDKELDVSTMLTTIDTWAIEKIFPIKYCNAMKALIINNNVTGLDQCNNLYYLFNASTQILSKLDNEDQIKTQLKKLDGQLTMLAA